MSHLTPYQPEPGGLQPLDQPPGPGWWQAPADAAGIVRWWDGIQWTEATQLPMSPQPQIAMPPQMVVPPQIVMPPPYATVTSSPKHTAHGLHLFLTIITGGLWLFVWIPVTIFNKSTREKSYTRVENQVTRIYY